MNVVVAYDLMVRFEKNDTISSEHYFLHDEKEREQLLKVCVDFAKKQSPPHSIPIARVG
jgi:hypothetical protein